MTIILDFNLFLVHNIFLFLMNNHPFFSIWHLLYYDLIKNHFQFIIHGSSELIYNFTTYNNSFFNLCTHSFKF